MVAGGWRPPAVSAVAAVLLGALAVAGQAARDQNAAQAATQSLARSLAPPQHHSAASSSPPDSTGPVGITLRDLQQGGLCQTGAPAIPVVELGIAQAHAAMLAGSLNCSALVAAYLQRIAAFDQRTQLNSIRALHPHAVEVSCPTKPPWQHCQPAAILCCSFGCPAPAPAPPSLTCCEPLRSPACWHAACR